jgi:hypothetical protein
MVCTMNRHLRYTMIEKRGEYKVEIYPKEAQKDFFDALEEECGDSKFWKDAKAMIRNGNLNQAFGEFIVGVNLVGEGDNNLFIEQAYNALIYYRDSLNTN